MNRVSLDDKWADILAKYICEITKLYVERLPHHYQTLYTRAVF